MKELHEKPSVVTISWILGIRQARKRTRINRRGAHQLVMAESRGRIERIIETDPVIKKGLQRGIINSRALARYIRESDGVEISTDAILGIIRRYPITKEESSSLPHALKDCELALRSKIGDLLLEVDSNVMKAVLEFAESLKTSRGENLRILVGLKSIRVIAEQRSILQLKESLRDSAILKFGTNLVEISVLLSHEAEETKGVIARITTEVALNDVAICGTAYVAPEFIILVAEKDAVRAYEALQKMLSEAVVSSSRPPMTSVYADA